MYFEILVVKYQLEVFTPPMLILLPFHFLLLLFHKKKKNLIENFELNRKNIKKEKNILYLLQIYIYIYIFFNPKVESIIVNKIKPKINK